MERKFEDLTNNFPTNEKILSLPDVNEVFNTQLDKKVSSGFHKYLNQTEEEYRKGYGLLNNLLLKLTSQDRGVLSLVETRIPFVTQTDLLRITRDPSLFYNPQERLNSQPYIALLKVIKHNDPLFAYESTVEGKIKKSTDEFQLSEDFGIEVVSYATNQYWRQEGTALVPTKEPCFEEEEITEEIIRVHSNAFAYAHDSSQRERGGILSIIEHNPTVVAYHKENRELAALGYLEKDDRFSFNNLNLVEPTYFTDPKYEKNGLSMHLRKATQRLLDMSNQIDVYNNQPVIVFNESIRITSFPLALQSGCELGGEIDTSITGDLGDAYTYIGPANPQTGLMPLGVTYYIDPRIRSKIV